MQLRSGLADGPVVGPCPNGGGVTARPGVGQLVERPLLEHSGPDSVGGGWPGLSDNRRTIVGRLCRIVMCFLSSGFVRRWSKINLGPQLSTPWLDEARIKVSGCGAGVYAGGGQVV